MTVRTSILAVLTLGPAYGLQLHSEIEARTCRPGAINVGQIYSTLNRLVEAGLVVTASRTDDRLPLYELTPRGLAEARTLLGSAPAVAPAWGDMVEHVLLAASLPGVELSVLLEGYRAVWLAPAAANATPLPTPLPTSSTSVSMSVSVSVSVSTSGEHPGPGPDARGLSRAADRLLAAAALEWVAGVAAQHAAGALNPYGLSALRPKRGRRPAVVA